MLEYIGNFPGLLFGFAWYIAYPLFILLIAYWLIYLLKNQEKFLLNQMDTAVAVYLAVMFFTAVHGFFKGYELKILLWDFMPVSFFLGYFIFLYSPLKNKIGKFYTILLISSLFVSLQFLNAVVKYRTLVILFRIISEHIHIVQFAIPFLMATLIYSKSSGKKVLFSILLLLNILAVVFCQQRSLYAATALTVFFMCGVFLYTRRDWIKRNSTRFMLIIASIVTIIIVMFIVLQIITKGKFFLTLYSRLFIFLNLNRLSSDISWKGRWREIRSALHGLEHFWLFGKGFGVSQITRFRYVRQIVLDQSYIYYIWKTGVVGLLSFLYMYFIFFKRAISTLKKAITTDERIFIIAALLNTAGMMLIAFANVSLGHFRLMFVWAALFACTEIIARKYD